MKSWLAKWRDWRPRWIELFWLVPLGAPVFLLVALWRMPWPEGHDSGLHLEHALALEYLSRAAPRAAARYLPQIEVHWSPLTYFTAAVFLRVSRSVAAFHATTFLYALLFLVFLRRCTARLIVDRELRLLAVLVVLANPEWPFVFTSFNVEPAHLAGVVFILWALLRQADGLAAPRRALLGLACGVAFLAKLTTFFYFLPVFAGWFAYEMLRPGGDRRTRLSAAAFFLAAAAPPAIWHLPRLSSLWQAAGQFIRLQNAQDVMPWHYYPRVMLFQFGGLPLLLACLAAAPKMVWRAARPAVFLPLAAGLSALCVLTAFGFKRPMYVYGCYLLATLFLVAALELAPLGRRWIRTLVVLYAALAVLLWHPPLARAYRWLSLGGASTAQIAAMDDLPARPAVVECGAGFGDIHCHPPYTLERRLAAQLQPLFASHGVYIVASLDFQEKVDTYVVEQMLAMNWPPFALVRGLFIPLRQALDRQAVERLDSACFLTAFEKPDAHGPSWEALKIDSDASGRVPQSDKLRQRLEESRPEWREALRLPLGETTLAVYQNDRHCDAADDRTPPDVAALGNLLANYYHPSIAEAAAIVDALLPRGVASREPDPAIPFARRLVDWLPPGWPARQLLADRLYLRLCQSGRRDDAAALAASLRPHYAVGRTLAPPDLAACRPAAN